MEERVMANVFSLFLDVIASPVEEIIYSYDPIDTAMLIGGAVLAVAVITLVIVVLAKRHK